LFPLTVIKTRMMALDDAHRGFRGVYYTARDVVRYDGVRGLYKGFGTVVGGLIPGRMVYLGILEASKKSVSSMMQGYNPSYSETFLASTSSFVAGGIASLSGQLVAVPVDVISQRQMISGGADKSVSQKINSSGGLALARHIIKTEGIRGLYRGLGASVLTFVPASAIWWSSYGAWQSVIWAQWDRGKGIPHQKGSAVVRPENEILTVQIFSGVLTGWTTACITNPMDVVKTRIQTSSNHDGPSTWAGTVVDIFQRDGIRGYFRGVVPRMASASIWGTAMVTTYEFLKRMCIKEEQ
jgi:solute carrier family 25 protein 44